MPYSGQLTIDGGTAAPATVELGDEALALAANGSAITLAYVDIDELVDDDYTLRLRDYTGRRYELTMLGKAYGQILADLRLRRDERLGHDLLLTGVALQDTYPGKLFGGETPEPVELRLFEDLLVVVPERGTMWGLPFSFVEEVIWDEELYQVRVATDDGQVYVFGHLAKRSEEFRDELLRLLAALERRTAATLQALLPGASPAAVSALAAVMRDGRAVQQHVVDELAPGLWPSLEDAVVGPDLKESYEALKAQSPAGWTALGVKTVRASDAEAPGDVVLWFFCPLGRDGKPVNAVAHEITSEQGHATYLYRPVEAERWPQLADAEIADAVRAGVTRINRAILTLNFRREPIYAPAEEIENGRYSRYRVALRKLDYLRFTRDALLGRAIHNESWAKQVDDAVARA
ncbi:MAG: hypothetical protein M3R70_01550 [Actinomycetota bacterium]|nr:hypothetical protein [Actinomycetota bacterium]